MANTTYDESDATSTHLLRVPSHPQPQNEEQETSTYESDPDAQGPAGRGAKVIFWASRMIPIFAVIGCVVLIAKLLANSDNWSTDEDSPGRDKLTRETQRGMFASIVVASGIDPSRSLRRVRMFGPGR